MIVDNIEEKSEEELLNEKLSSLQKYLVLLPHAINISIPKVEIDILHADKSNNTEHNSLHFVFGCSLKFSVISFLSSLSLGYFL